MFLDNFLVSKSRFMSKALDLADDLKHMEDQMDDLYKINLYLMRRYKDDLIKELGIKKPEKLPEEFYMLPKIFNNVIYEEDEMLEFYTILAATNKIREKMKEEMPEPWYCYGFGSKPLA